MISFNLIIPAYLLLVVIFFSFFIFYRYYRNLKNQEIAIRYILISLRFASFFLLLLIFIRPTLSKNKTILRNKEISIFLDNSKSMSYSYKINDFKNEIDLAVKNLTINNINSKIYLFGDTVRSINKVSKIDFMDKTTDLNQVGLLINSLDSDEYIIISDGMQNKSVIDFNIENNKPLINTFGVGIEDSEKEDISIDSVIVTKISKDSIYIKCKIHSNILFDYNSVPIKLSNNKVSDKILTYIDIYQDNSTFLYNFRILKSELSNNNIIYIDYLQNEFYTDNNYYHLQLDSNNLYKKRVLLLSGRLSQNTKYIKNLIEDQANLDLTHIYKFSESILQDFDYSSRYNTIIFDSFPINTKNLLFINENDIFKYENMVFFQGPSTVSDYNIYNKFLLEWGYSFVPDNTEDSKSTLLYSNDIRLYENILNKIVPINIQRSVLNKRDKSTIYDNRNNTIIDYYNNNLFVFIPNLTKVSNETLNIYRNDNLKFLITSFLQKVIFGSEKYDITIYTDKDTYSINQKVNLYVEIDNNYIEFNDIDIYIYNRDGSIQSKVSQCNLLPNNLYECNTGIASSGDYFIQAKAKSPRDFNIMSNEINIFINELDIEVKNIGLNRKILENISLNYAGSYFNLKKLNDYIYSIDSNSYSELELKETLIFNFQSFWFIILFLLIIEWIVRKNKGLL